MAFSSLITWALRQFGNCPATYLRTKEETGGSSLFFVEGSRSFEYLPIEIPITIKTMEDKGVVEDTNRQSVKRVRILIMYDDVITEQAVDAATGVIVGGTYSEENQQVTGGDYYEFEEGTAVKQRIDNDTPSGVFVMAHYVGEYSDD